MSEEQGMDCPDCGREMVKRYSGDNQESFYCGHCDAVWTLRKDIEADE